MIQLQEQFRSIAIGDVRRQDEHPQ